MKFGKPNLSLSKVIEEKPLRERQSPLRSRKVKAALTRDRIRLERNLYGSPLRLYGTGPGKSALDRFFYPVPNEFIICTLYVTPYVHYMLHHMFTICSLFIHYLFTIYSLILKSFLINTYSMKQPMLYWSHKNDVTSLVKFCMENTARRWVFSGNFPQACDVILWLQYKPVSETSQTGP